MVDPSISVSPVAGSGALLRRLREMMAQPLPTQQRLDRIVSLIATHMRTETCSIYLRDHSRRFELCASHGLNEEAIHKTILAPREGLIGNIAAHARPLNLTEAQAHPAYAYRKETGEEVYHSFLGVPILRNGHVIGVLTARNRAARHYTEDDVDILLTVAMLLAELQIDEVLSSGSLSPTSRLPTRLHGAGWAPGIALGHVVLHELHIHINELIADDPVREHQRLNDAVYDLREEIDNMLNMPIFRNMGAHRDIFEAYRMFANDQIWFQRIHEAIDTGLTAEAAIGRERDEMRARFLHQSNPYLRARLHDLEELANRLLRHLSGAQSMAAEDLPDDAIIFARNISPAELLDYPREKLRGVVMEEGAAHAHITIVARALELALVGRLPDMLSQAKAGASVIVNGDDGEVYLSPDESVIEAYKEKVRFRAQRQAYYRERVADPAITQDGVEIQLLMNAGLLVDLPHLEESGAAGIGLFRTELQFMVVSTMPRLDEQVKVYRQVLEAAKGVATFRTLDIGGDKILPYMDRAVHDMEENPSLGWRAIRIALDRPALLRYQLRALLAAARGYDLNVLFPMISEAAEFTAARHWLDREISRARKLKQELPNQIQAGAMLEVPALIWQLDRLLPLVDFLSIGSNDLLQFLFASDRSNTRLSGRYDEMSLPVLRALRDIQCAAVKYDVPVTLCGELASTPLTALATIGLGLTRIAMAPTSIGPVKQAIRAVNYRQLSAKMAEICDITEDDLTPRARLAAFAKMNDIPVD